MPTPTGSTWIGPSVPGSRRRPRTRAARAAAPWRSTPRATSPRRTRDPARRGRTAGRTTGTSTAPVSLTGGATSRSGARNDGRTGRRLDHAVGGAGVAPALTGVERAGAGVAGDDLEPGRVEPRSDLLLAVREQCRRRRPTRVRGRRRTAGRARRRSTVTKPTMPDGSSATVVRAIRPGTRTGKYGERAVVDEARRDVRVVGVVPGGVPDGGDRVDVGVAWRAATTRGSCRDARVGMRHACVRVEILARATDCARRSRTPRTDRTT